MTSHCAPFAAPTAVSLTRVAWFATIAGLSGSLVSIGLARFVYTPLIPPLIAAHWFSAAEAVALGAANFVGYRAAKPASSNGGFRGPGHDPGTIQRLAIMGALCYVAPRHPQPQAGPRSRSSAG
jgi:hypothetical protein